ncbi:MAG TPA: RDD family protein [Acidimicrobiia bacterium]|nr:RDD family protein [Acidimicrobiia bacterium]
MGDRMTRPCPWCGEDAPSGSPTCAHCGVALELPSMRPAGSPAGPLARLLGAFVDSLVSYLFGLALWLAAPVSNDENAWLLWVGIASYEVIGTAYFGRTIGKLVAHTRVQRVDSGGVPGLTSAVVRWFVPSLPVVVATAFAAASLFAFPWVLVVYLPIFATSRRGLHDYAARTVVVYA